MSSITSGTDSAASFVNHPGLVSLHELKQNIMLLQKAVREQEPRLVHRVLRTIPRMRQQLSVPVLVHLIEDTLKVNVPAASGRTPSAAGSTGAAPDAMQVDTVPGSESSGSSGRTAASSQSVVHPRAAVLLGFLDAAAPVVRAEDRLPTAAQLEEHRKQLAAKIAARRAQEEAARLLQDEERKKKEAKSGKPSKEQQEADQKRQSEQKRLADERDRQEQQSVALDPYRPLPALDADSTTSVSEPEMYVHLMLVIFLLDRKHLEHALPVVQDLLQRIGQDPQVQQRRTAHALAAKVYFYFSRVYEQLDRLQEIRPTLLQLFRTASLKKNDEAQATLLNLLLRNYLHYNLFEQADKLLSKTQLREDVIGSNEYARYLFYQGHIRAIQLDYSDAFRCLMSAVRKAPQQGAFGFREQGYKLAIIVQLLMGDVPDRSIFREPGLQRALQPYLQLTRAVRVGDLAAFRQAVNEHEATFLDDKTFTLIQRLRRSVIKTGLRKINVAYSRISLQDIADKLHLESALDAEYVVAKAIRDGVILAQINHEQGYVQSKENLDVYATEQPLNSFHRRTTYYLKTYADSVKAMRYPEVSKPFPTETALERRMREEDIASSILDEEDF